MFESVPLFVDGDMVGFLECSGSGSFFSIVFNKCTDMPLLLGAASCESCLRKHSTFKKRLI